MYGRCAARSLSPTNRCSSVFNLKVKMDGVASSTHKETVHPGLDYWTAQQRLNVGGIGLRPGTFASSLPTSADPMSEACQGV
jgi:hypothetical protein